VTGEWQVEVVGSAQALPDTLFGASASPHLTRRHWIALERDCRYRTQYLLAARRSALATVPLHAPLHPRWPDMAYMLGGWKDARGVLFVGGRTDFRTPSLAAGPTDPTELESAASALLAAARDEAAQDSRRAVLVYVEETSPLAVAAEQVPGASRQLRAARYAIADVGETEAAYLAGLDRRRRSVVRRDRRALADAGVTVEVTRWENVLPWACAGIAAVHESHGIRTHPDLVRHRLATWLGDPDANRIAFVASAPSGTRAVTLGWRYEDTLELYEIALPESGAPRRLLCYLAAMFYGPFDYMRACGLRKLDLALDSEKPKTLRGAVWEPLFDVMLPS
jgi:hypothetical protein